jgi:hypothetical protein
MKKVWVASLSGILLIFSAFPVFSQNMYRKVSDFDGDGRADFAVTRNLNNQKHWWIWQTTAGLIVVQWGLQFDLPAASDYDGDGKADVAVYREPTSFPALYTYYILESGTGALSYKVFTTPANLGSRMMHQDYNGDGRTDAAINTGETQVSVKYSGSDSGFTTTIPPGEVTFRGGDMDGGGLADIMHYKPSNNVVTIRSLETNTSRTLQFGNTNDLYEMADFDGDGKGDLTVWQRTSSDWIWIKSSDNTVQSLHWGQEGDVPVPADYDGDGRTDQAIYRPGAQGYYWINGSQNGVFVFPWGMTGDVPVRY